MKLILEFLEKYEILHRMNKTELRCTVRGNEIIFRGLDDPEKVKSYEPYYVWVEEAYELSETDFNQLNLRLRRANDKANQIYMSFNPVDRDSSWIYKRFWQNREPGAAKLETNYNDNIRYLSKQYIKELQSLKSKNETYYEIYTLGRWGVRKDLIYKNWRILEEWPKKFDEIIYGLDFGFNSPTALLEIGLLDILNGQTA